MSPEPDRPGPVDCLQRGLRSLRANWQLVPALALQALTILALTLAGCLVLLAALGVSVFAWLQNLGPDWPQQVGDDLLRALEASPPALLPLLPALLAASLAWSLAFALTCYLQGGAVRVLAEAESGAGPGLPTWRSFRAFSVASFDCGGRRLFWRYFWLNHLIGAVVLAWGLLLLLWVLLAVRLAVSGDITVGVATGCVGLVPLFLLLFAASLWSLLATVEAARWGAGVWQASRRGLAALRRLFVPVLVLWLLAMAGSMAAGAVFAPMRWAAALALGERLLLSLGARGFLVLAETAVSCAVAVVLVASLAALLRLHRSDMVEAA